MIKTQRKPLFSYVFSFLFFLFYFAIPVYCGVEFYSPQFIKFILLIYISFACVIFILLRHAREKKLRFSFKNEKLTEDINILNEKIRKRSAILSVLKDKIRRYSALKSLTEKLVQTPSLDVTAELILSRVYALIAHSHGRIVLYLVDTQKQELNLFVPKSGLDSRQDIRKDGERREPDIFDKWVFKHQVPLFVEDTKKDFRFDADISSLEEYHAGSLISAPLVVSKRIIGILRLEDDKTNSFSSDDLRFLSVFSDLAALSLDNSRLYEHTQYLAVTDGLTGLYLRHHFMVCLNSAIKNTVNSGTPFSILMIDIDCFKKYNDKFGHISGDIVLSRIANALRLGCSKKDAVLSRYGGEEFIILLANTEKKEAVEAAENLRKRIAREKIVLRRIKSSITVSIGISTCPEDGRVADELLKISDLHLYKAKQDGRNRICFY